MRLMGLVEKVQHMQAHMGNFFQRWNYRANQIKMLEMQTTITEWRIPLIISSVESTQLSIESMNLKQVNTSYLNKRINNRIN